MTKVGDLHEAWLLRMTEDGSFDDVLPAYKTFANNVMLLQGTRLVNNNWDQFKLRVHDLETLDAFVAPLLGVLFLLIDFFLNCVLSNFVFPECVAKGSRLTLGGLGVEPCSRSVVSTSATVRNRPQVSAVER